MIFCNCSKGCGPLCGCRKLGLHCSSVCGNCHGQSCLNVAPIDDSSETEVNKDEEIDNAEINPMDYLQQSIYLNECENKEQVEEEEEGKA